MLQQIKNYIPNNIKSIWWKYKDTVLTHKQLQNAVNNEVDLIPKYLGVETTNNCNAGCVFCPQPEIMQRTKGLMKMDTWELIYNLVVRYKIQRVHFGGMGEPFVDKKILDRIKQLTDIGCASQITSNGSLLSKQDPEKIIKSGLKYLNVSMDALKTEWLHEIKVGLKKFTIEEIEGALKGLKNKKNEMRSRYPIIKVQYQITKESNFMDNPDLEAAMIHERMDPIADIVRVKGQHDWLGAMEGYGVDQRAPGDGSKNNICGYFTDQINIDWNGDVTFCCMDFDSTHKLGNIYNNTLEEIFNSKHIKLARKLYLEKKIHTHKLCQGCYKDPN